jgi:hypothetical protein
MGVRKVDRRFAEEGSKFPRALPPRRSGIWVESDINVNIVVDIGGSFVLSFRVIVIVVVRIALDVIVIADLWGLLSRGERRRAKSRGWRRGRSAVGCHS